MLELCLSCLGSLFSYPAARLVVGFGDEWMKKVGAIDLFPLAVAFSLFRRVGVIVT